MIYLTLLISVDIDPVEVILSRKSNRKAWAALVSREMFMLEGQLTWHSRFANSPFN